MAFGGSASECTEAGEREIRGKQRVWETDKNIQRPTVKTSRSKETYLVDCEV